MRGHANDGQMRPEGSLACADGRRRFHSVHLGHLHIHQYSVEALKSCRFEEVERFAAIRSQDDVMAPLTQERHGEFRVDYVVFSQKQAQRTHGFASFGGRDSGS